MHRQICADAFLYIVAGTLSECFLQSGMSTRWGRHHCLLVIIKFPLIKKPTAKEFSHSNHDCCNRYETLGKRNLFKDQIALCSHWLSLCAQYLFWELDHWRYKSAFYAWRPNYSASGLSYLWNKMSHVNIMCRGHISLLSPRVRPAVVKWFFMQG